MRAVIYADNGRQGAEGLTIIDLLADPGACTRDIPYLQELGMNTLIVREVIPSAQHSICMERLADAGIYVIFDIRGPTSASYILDGLIWTPTDYTLFEYLEALIDMAQEYPNTLGFRVTIRDNDIDHIPEYKSWISHMKEHIQSKGYRRMPIGFLLYPSVSSKAPTPVIVKN
jgi:Glucanosyltransferase